MEETFFAHGRVLPESELTLSMILFGQYGSGFARKQDGEAFRNELRSQLAVTLSRYAAIRFFEGIGDAFWPYES
jgi:hypothetical protein